MKAKKQKPALPGSGWMGEPEFRLRTSELCIENATRAATKAGTREVFLIAQHHPLQFSVHHPSGDVEFAYAKLSDAAPALRIGIVIARSWLKAKVLTGIELPSRIEGESVVLLFRVTA